MTTGFDLDEIERLMGHGLVDRNHVAAMIAAIRELRATVATLGDSARAGANALDAKDTAIRELRAENARLKEALGMWIAYDDMDEADFATVGPMLHYAAAIDAARAALGEPQ